MELEEADEIVRVTVHLAEEAQDTVASNTDILSLCILVHDYTDRANGSGSAERSKGTQDETTDQAAELQV